MLTDTQLREIFHFCFLDRLLKISDPGMYVLKGGVNLRFFFNSPRYSEDMDLDVLAGSVDTLRKNGYKILQDGAFKRSLLTYGITDIEVNDPAKAKQTETTQRFRFGLITTSNQRLPTKVEFSRRNKPVNNYVKEMINSEIARQYHRLSYRCNHYPGEYAVMQKIQALAGRPATQARDVFDLYLLQAGGYANSIKSNKTLTRELREKA
ncbi:MAG: nucleotidyl transferase AbiEii/AbiGii toxin family protein, partial [Gammaproteobacteria bacterium]|nr:nucleotidyl transferase AbiEii/AbiGii toxin family protein [Gammaproteobacteria bacterium]